MPLRYVRVRPTSVFCAAETIVLFQGAHVIFSNSFDMKKSCKDDIKTITQFFSKTKKLENNFDETESSKEGSSKECDVYFEALKIQSEKLQEEPSQPIESNAGSNEDLHDTIARLEAQLIDEKKAKQKLIEQYDVLKKKYTSSLQLLVKTQRLLINHSKYVKDVPDRGENNNIDDATINPVLPQSINPQSVSKYVSDAELVMLNSIQSQKNYDSTYINKLVDILYTDKKKLLLRTVSGRSRLGENKQAVSPEKMGFINQMFLNRIKNSNAEKEEQITRINETYIIRLLSNAISNINRKTKQSELPTN